LKLKIPEGTTQEESKKIVHNFVVKFVIASMALDWLGALAVGALIALLLSSVNLTMFSYMSTWMLMTVLILLVYYTYAAYENNRQATYDNVMLKLMARYMEGDGD